MKITRAFTVPDEKVVLHALAQARTLGLQFWYFPRGGMTAHFYVPVTHKVVVRGWEAQVDKFQILFGEE